jgi:hypothetical protein
VKPQKPKPIRVGKRGVQRTDDVRGAIFQSWVGILSDLLPRGRLGRKPGPEP